MCGSHCRILWRSDARALERPLPSIRGFERPRTYKIVARLSGCRYAAGIQQLSDEPQSTNEAEMPHPDPSAIPDAWIEASTLLSAGRFAAAARILLKEPPPDALNNTELEAVYRTNLGAALAESENLCAAFEILREAESYYSGHNKPAGLAPVLFNLGNILRYGQGHGESIAYLQRSADMSRIAGLPEQAAQALITAAHSSLDHPPVAADFLEGRLSFAPPNVYPLNSARSAAEIHNASLRLQTSNQRRSHRRV
jgi:tetratricopeptide (TPR) repeat protein